MRISKSIIYVFVNPNDKELQKNIRSPFRVIKSEYCKYGEDKLTVRIADKRKKRKKILKEFENYMEESEVKHELSDIQADRWTQDILDS